MLYNMPVFKDNKREGNYCSFRAAVWKYHALKTYTCIWQLHGLFRTREKWSEMKRQKSKSFSPSSFQVDKRPKKGKALYVCDSKLLPRLEQVYSFCIMKVEDLYYKECSRRMMNPIIDYYFKQHVQKQSFDIFCVGGRSR